MKTKEELLKGNKAGFLHKKMENKFSQLPLYLKILIIMGILVGIVLLIPLIITLLVTLFIIFLTFIVLLIGIVSV